MYHIISHVFLDVFFSDKISCLVFFRWENIIYQLGEAETLITHVIKKGQLVFSKTDGFIGF